MIEINYDNLHKNYENKLLDKLRDFGDDYLKYWIPDSNFFVSFFKLIFSVVENNHSSLSIEISNKYKQRFKKLDQYLRTISNFEIITEENRIYKIKNVDKKLLSELLVNLVKKEKSIKIKVKKKLIKTKRKNSSSIKKKYLYHLIENKNELKFTKKTKFNYHSRFNGYGLYLKIENNIIKDLHFTKGKNKFENILLNEYCKVIKNLEIQEAFEHGTIKLEYRIRPKEIQKEIPGIINTYSVSKIFNIQQNLIKLIFKKIMNLSEKKKNIFQEKDTISWINAKNKQNIIQQSIKDFKLQKKLNYDIHLTEINNLNNNLLTIKIESKKNYNSLEYSNILLELEIFLRNKISKNIEIFYKTAKDENKLRQFNTDYE